MAVAESGGRSGGHFRTENLFKVLNAARHVIDCEGCQSGHRMIIGFKGMGVIDYWLPEKLDIPDAAEEIARASSPRAEIEIPPIPRALPWAIVWRPFRALLGRAKGALTRKQK